MNLATLFHLRRGVPGRPFLYCNVALAALWIWVAMLGSAAQAQTPGNDTRAAVYRYARPGQETMRVGVWGSVGQPGLYEVPNGTDLLDLLSISGGPDVSLEDPRSQQTITLRVARPRASRDTSVGALQPGSSGARRVVFEAPLEKISDPDRDLPNLQSGDVVTVEKTVRERFTWRDVLSVFQAAGTVAIIALNAIRIGRD